MKRMIMALALGAAIFGIASCGGDDGNDSSGSGQLTLAEYFAAYQDLTQGAEEQFDSIAPDIDGAGASLDEQKSSLVTFLEDLRDIAHDLLAELDDLDPPDEVQTLHEDSLAAGDDLVEGIDSVIAEVEDFGSLTDILDFDFNATAFTSAGERLDELCAELQKLADDEGIDVDLSCE